MPCRLKDALNTPTAATAAAKGEAAVKVLHIHPSVRPPVFLSERGAGTASSQPDVDVPVGGSWRKPTPALVERADIQARTSWRRVCTTSAAAAAAAAS